MARLKAVLGLASVFIHACHALLAFTNTNWTVASGQAFTLAWSGNSGAVGINIVNGTEGRLKVVESIDINDSQSSLTWTPPDSLPSGNYMFQITDSTGAQAYSSQFTYSARPSGASSTAPAPTSTASNDSPPPPGPELTLADKIGIGIGAGAAAMLGMALCSFVFYRRGKVAGLSLAAAQSRPHHSYAGHSSNANMDVNAGEHKAVLESYRYPLHELGTNANVAELQSPLGTDAQGSGSGSSPRVTQGSPRVGTVMEGSPRLGGE